MHFSSEYYLAFALFRYTDFISLQREQNLTARKLYSPPAETSQSYSFLIRNLFDKSHIPPCRKWQEYNKFTANFLSNLATMDDVNGIQRFVMNDINSRMARYVSLLKTLL